MGGLSALGAISRFGYAAGTTGNVTVPAGAVVVAVTCLCVSGGPGGTLTITPGGPNQTGSAGSAIPIPAGGSFDRAWSPGLSPLGGGTVFAFASTDSYYVEYATNKVGA